MFNLFNLTVENQSGQSITLTQNESDYQVLEIDGLNPPKALIQSNAVVGMDGSRFASSKLETRNIVITVKINGDAESNRLRLYRYFKTKQRCKIYYSNDSRSVYAEGYVETVECNIFENGQKMQISIICHDPYLNDIDEIVYDLSQVMSLFEFPFSFGGQGIISPTDTDDPIEFSVLQAQNFVNIVNAGDTDCGFIIELTMRGRVVNPAIYCLDDASSFRVNCTLESSDVLIINTVSGEKSVKLMRNGVEYNYLRYVGRGSKWLTVRQGDNQFTYDAESGGEFIQMLVKFRTKYEAV